MNKRKIQKTSQYFNNSTIAKQFGNSFSFRITPKKEFERGILNMNDTKASQQ